MGTSAAHRQMASGMILNQYRTVPQQYITMVVNIVSFRYSYLYRNDPYVYARSGTIKFSKVSWYCRDTWVRKRRGLSTLAWNVASLL